ATVKNTIKKYDALTGKYISTFKDTAAEEIKERICFKDMTRVITRTNYYIEIWDYEQEKIIKEFTFKKSSFGSIHTASLTKDNKYVLISIGNSIDNDSLFIINTDTYLIDKVIDVSDRFNAIEFSPDGNNFITGIHKWNQTNQETATEIYLWNTNTWSRVSYMIKLIGDVTKFVFSPDGKMLFCLKEGFPAYLIDMQSYKVIREYKPQNSEYMYRSAAFSHDSRYLFLGSGGSDIYTRGWNIIMDTLCWEYHNLSSRCIEITPDNQYLLKASPILLIKLGLNNTGIEEEVNKIKVDFSVYYKNDTITMNFIQETSAITELNILDLKGNLVKSINLGLIEEGTITIKRNIVLPSGIYFAALETTKHSISQKFEVIR
ncbi:MAG: C-terminal target protein, partial [Bacteroidota bacterium]|nr:C-terminal target protein [Bacteroidota bacterium]